MNVLEETRKSRFFEWFLKVFVSFTEDESGRLRVALIVNCTS
jgi:hypothetical protein